MSYKLCCVITGKTTVITEDYYNKKVKEFGSQEKLSGKYICRQAKNLLVRGYTVEEIRKLLKVSKAVPQLSEQVVQDIMQDNDVANIISGVVSVKKSDPEVARFIEAIKSI